MSYKKISAGFSPCSKNRKSIIRKIISHKRKYVSKVCVCAQNG